MSYASRHKPEHQMLFGSDDPLRAHSADTSDDAYDSLFSSSTKSSFDNDAKPITDDPLSRPLQDAYRAPPPIPQRKRPEIPKRRLPPPPPPPPSVPNVSYAPSEPSMPSSPTPEEPSVTPPSEDVEANETEESYSSRSSSSFFKKLLGRTTLKESHSSRRKTPTVAASHWAPESPSDNITNVTAGPIVPPRTNMNRSRSSSTSIRVPPSLPERTPHSIAHLVSNLPQIQVEANNNNNNHQVDASHESETFGDDEAQQAFAMDSTLRSHVAPPSLTELGAIDNPWSEPMTPIKPISTMSTPVGGSTPRSQWFGFWDRPETLQPRSNLGTQEYNPHANRALALDIGPDPWQNP